MCRCRCRVSTVRLPSAGADSRYEDTQSRPKSTARPSCAKERSQSIRGFRMELSRPSIGSRGGSACKSAREPCDSATSRGNLRNGIGGCNPRRLLRHDSGQVRPVGIWPSSPGRRLHADDSLQSSAARIGLIDRRAQNACSMLRCRRTEARNPRIEDERWAASGLSTRSLSPVSIRGSAVRLTCGADFDLSQEKGDAILADVLC